ncbi:MAG: lipopolysaccharide biosynthesis protein RfbH [Dehalococcoidales bacterium]|nr:lipopolysaccharide biosynthesis protein RfbH [Dehalococcoidales bacterium]
MDDRARALKQEILDRVKEYYELVHQHKEFVPGKSKVHYAGRVYDAGEMCNMVDAVLDFWVTLGPYAARMEKELARYVGVKEAILVNSGSSANLVAITSLMSPELSNHLSPGDEVITPAVTFPTTFSPIIQNGLVPVLVDCELGTYNITPEKVRAGISSKTRAVFIPHTLGNPCCITEIAAICAEQRLHLIEDSCDALGSKYDGRMVGGFGAFGTLSCYPAHHISMGEGGAVFTNDARMAKIARSVRDWGRECWCKGDASANGSCGKRFQYKIDIGGGREIEYDHRYVYSHMGYNLKPTDIQAAMGVAQLQKLDWIIERRRHNFARLLEGLKQYGGSFVLPEWDKKAEPSWFAFPLTVRPEAKFSRRELLEFLEKANIETRLLFAGNIVRQPAFRNVKCRVSGSLVNSDLVMANTFFIGVYPGISDEAIDYILAKFKEFLESRK